MSPGFDSVTTTRTAVADIGVLGGGSSPRITSSPAYTPSGQLSNLALHTAAKKKRERAQRAEEREAEEEEGGDGERRGGAASP